MSPSKAAVEHPVLTLIVFSLLGIMGIFTLSNVAIDLFPDTDIPMIVVMTATVCITLGFLRFIRIVTLRRRIGMRLMSAVLKPVLTFNPMRLTA